MWANDGIGDQRCRMDKYRRHDDYPRAFLRLAAVVTAMIEQVMKLESSEDPLSRETAVVVLRQLRTA